MEKTKSILKKVVELFKYQNNNKKYLNKPKIYKQIVNKDFSIAEAF